MHYRLALLLFKTMAFAAKMKPMFAAARRGVSRLTRGTSLAWLLCCGLGAGLATACDGSKSALNGDDDSVSLPSPAAPAVEGDRPALRRLTHAEYRRTVTDLFGSFDVGIDALTANFPKEENYEGFSNDSRTLSVSSSHLLEYLLVAEAIGNKVAAAPSTVMGCDPTAAPGDLACVKSFVTGFGKKAYRRPLSATEVDALVGMYSTSKKMADPTQAIVGLITSVLMSPSFLYRSEMGTNGSATLTQHEIASRLSYLLVGSPPDEILYELAEKGALSSAESRLAQAQRLLATPRARETSLLFYEQWLALKAVDVADKDPAAYPEFTPAVRAAMATETRAFIEDVLWKNDGRLETLLQANYSIVPPALAAIYGVTIPAKGGSIRIDFDPSQRAGILTQASILSTQAGTEQSSPTMRGKFVRERLLCGTLLPAPATVLQDVPGPNAANTTRERFQQHQADPACTGCHQQMDPIGFGLENFDAIGRYRDKDGTFPVDASGKIFGGGDAEGDFKGFRELSQRLAASKTVSDCITRQMFQYSFGRAPDAEDKATLDSSSSRFTMANKSLKEIVLAFIAADSFTKR